MNLTFHQQEQVIKTKLSEYLNDDQFVYFHEYQNSNFRRFKDKTLEQYTIYGMSLNGIHSFTHEFAYLDIQDIIFQIGLPHIRLNNYDRNIHFLFTIRNNEINLDYNTEKNPVLTDKDCIEYCQSIIRYIDNEGKQFVKKYSYLPNILLDMNRDTLNGVYWSQGILQGIEARSLQFFSQHGYQQLFR
jgi:hypothetical protein